MAIAMRIAAVLAFSLILMARSAILVMFFIDHSIDSL